MTVSFAGMTPRRVMHAWHLSVSIQCSLKRWALRGMCPLRICRSRLLWEHVKSFSRFLNLLKGKVLSMSSIRARLGESCHCSSHMVLSSELYACFSAVALLGRGWRNIGGSSGVGLDSPCAACLASSSAFSLPDTLLCPEIQLSCMLPGKFSIADRRVSTM